MTLPVISQVDNASQTYLTFVFSIVNTINYQNMTKVSYNMGKVPYNL